MHVRAGFRTVLRHPALVVGEITWRWTFGAAAWVLVVAVFRRILASVDVSQAESLMARRSDVFVIADAWARVLLQVLPQFARACALLVPALALIWVVAATLGRAATLRAMLTAAGSVPRTRFLALVGLNVLRALYALLVMAAFTGTMLLAGAAMPTLDITAAALAWIFLALAVVFFWSIVNWLLALAPIWIVRDGRAALKSIADSLELFRRETGKYVAIGWWFGLMRALAMAGAVVIVLLAAAASTSPAGSIAGCAVVTLIYLGVADFLYIARMAAYVALDEYVPPAAPELLRGAPPTTASPAAH